ncbi:MAG: PqqD family protein [Lachnospiraceae bacterium]|nr:PqqD family protein [Lachnospiraceae bacterium]
MKPKYGFIKTDICGTPCLLPYGQNIADHIPELKLNPTASLIWDLICKGMDKEQIASVLYNKYDAGAKNMQDILADITEYENILVSYGILENIPPSRTVPSSHAKYFQIGNIKIAFDGPNTIFEKYFQDFALPARETQYQQYIHFYKGKPRWYINGNVLVRNGTLSIIETGAEGAYGNSYIFTFPEEYGIYEMRVSKDGSAADIYCTPSLTAEHASHIFHALRFAFLITAQQHEMFVIHSASILYKGKAWLFSGCSGTGKSTHTALWNKLYNTPVLNGDLNIISIKENFPITYGLPWCGTSGIFTTEAYPLGGIIFLRQAAANNVITLSNYDKALSLIQRLVSPSWDAMLLQKNLDFAERIIHKIPVYRLDCTKEPEAAYTIKKTIDSLD